MKNHDSLFPSTVRTEKNNEVKEKKEEKKEVRSNDKKSKKSVSPHVVYGLIILILAIIIISSFVLSSDNKATISEQKNSLATEVEIEILPIGTKVFSMEAGQETRWLVFPEGRIGRYKIASPNFEYTIKFSDGTEYQGSANGVIPDKDHPQFKIYSKVKQFITVVIN